MAEWNLIEFDFAWRGGIKISKMSFEKLHSANIGFEL